MKKQIMIAIAVLIAALSFGNTIKHADRLYAKWDYYKAAQLYAKAAEKHPTQSTYYKLGECYEKMHRYKEAAAAFDKVNQMGPFDDASFYYNYGIVLKANERYSNAKAAFITYSHMVPNDTNANMYARYCDTIVKDHEYDIPISTVAVSSINSSESDLCPMRYKDGMVFVSSRYSPSHGNKIYGWDGEHYLEIFYTQKGKTDTSFLNITTLSDGTIDKKYHNGPVCFSKNYDTIYFNRVSKELKGKQKRTLNIERNKIYTAVYKDGKWTDVKPFQYNSDTFSVATPCLANNGSRIYFASDMPGGFGGVDLYYCDKQADGSWSKPVNMGPNVNTKGNEKFPVVDSLGNLYFSSDGYPGYGGMDICVAKRTNGNYEQAHVLKAPFNSCGDDYGVTFLKADRIGYFSSNRNGGKGSDDIYYFNMDKDSLPCPAVKVSDYIIGYKCTPKHQLVSIDTVKHIVVVPSTSNKTEMVRVHFDFDKYNIRPGDAKILDSVASYMRQNPDVTVNLNGYCDTRGSYAYNQTLSEKRSNSAFKYIAAKGINKSRMKPKGYGKTHLLNQCLDGVACSEFEQEQNRRVEIIFTPNKGIVSTK